MYIPQLPKFICKSSFFKIVLKGENILKSYSAGIYSNVSLQISAICKIRSNKLSFCAVWERQQAIKHENTKTEIENKGLEIGSYLESMLFEKLYETYNTVLHSTSRHFEMSAVSFFFHFFGHGRLWVWFSGPDQYQGLKINEKWR